MKTRKALLVLLIYFFAATVSATEGESNSGIEFGIIYKGELSSVLRGGRNQQTSYLENLDLRLTLI